MRNLRRWAGVAALALLLAACGNSAESPGSSLPETPETTIPTTSSSTTTSPTTTSAPGDSSTVALAECSVDIHQHLTAERDLTEPAEAMISLLDDVGIGIALIMPPPQSSTQEGRTLSYDDLAPVVADHPDRLGLIAGGSILSRTIHASAESGEEPTEAALDAFEADARRLVAAGIAGFGEMTVLHISRTDTHPFVSMPADHPMFLRLAEIAAAEGLPIDIHLELVTETMPLPTSFEAEPEGNNPAMLSENLVGFEALLDHAPDARIVWTHVGWDGTGEMTTDLLRRLLTDHPNLFLGLKMIDSAAPVPFPENRPLTRDGELRADWADLFEDFPDRFVLGADEFVGSGTAADTPGSPSTVATWSLIDELPDDLARAFACDNPRSIYRLSGIDQ